MTNLEDRIAEALTGYYDSLIKLGCDPEEARECAEAAYSFLYRVAEGDD